jgi:hypothetical protein
VIAVDYERLFNVAKEVLKAINAGIFISNRGCCVTIASLSKTAGSGPATIRSFRESDLTVTPFFSSTGWAGLPDIYVEPDLGESPKGGQTLLR